MVEEKYETHKKAIYLENLFNVKDVPNIKIITGVRRSDKSKLIKLVI